LSCKTWHAEAFAEPGDALRVHLQPITGTKAAELGWIRLGHTSKLISEFTEKISNRTERMIGNCLRGAATILPGDCWPSRKDWTIIRLMYLLVLGAAEGQSGD
jgi:hypothetical protein